MKIIFKRNKTCLGNEQKGRKEKVGSVNYLQARNKPVNCSDIIQINVINVIMYQSPKNCSIKYLFYQEEQLF